MRVFAILALCFSLAFYPVFAQQGPYPVPESPKEGGGGVNIGPAIVLPLLLIPMLIKKLTEGKDLPTYPVLEKKPVNISQSGNTYTINWVIYYANNTNTTQNNISITEGPINNIVPGSLQGPTGWTGTLNSTNTVATWTGNAPPINGYMSATVSITMATSFNISGSGDGYIAIPYRHKASGGKLRIYFINHHEPPGSMTIFHCVDATTGAICPNFPKRLPKGDNSGKFSSSGTYDEEYYIDPLGRLYYAVTASDKEFGLGCYNLETDQECGFYKLGTTTNTYMYVKGPWKVGNELYMVGGDRKLYCLDATNPNNFCASLNSYFTGFSFPLGAFPDPASPYPFSWGPAVFGEVINNRLYFLTDDLGNKNPPFVPKNIRVFCFDSGTKQACAGFTSSTQIHNIGAPGAWILVRSAFVYYDNAMNPKYICTRLNQTSQYCFDLNTGNPASPTTIFPSQNLNVGLSSETTIGARTYFPDVWYDSYNPPRGRVLCWDWSTGSLCVPAWEYKSWTNHPLDYTTNVDDNRCIWVVGHNSQNMWYFDPSKPVDGNGVAQKCESREDKREYVFEPWKYCSGPKPFLWTKVEIANASLSDFSKLIINIKDNAGNTIYTYDCVANNSLVVNLPPNVVNQTNGQPLKVEVDYALSGASNLQSFELRAYYHASPLEFCLKSQHNCSQSEVKNTVSVPGVQNQPMVEVSLPKPEHCPIYAEGGGNQPSGPSSGGQSGNTGGQDSGSGGVAPWLGGALLTPTPLPGGTGSAGGTGGTGNVGVSGGASSGATGGGVQVIEKDGQVQIAPEVKQRCYWKPKAKTPTESKPVVKKKTTSTVKKATTQKPEVKSSTTQTSKPPTKPVKKVAKKPKVQPASTQEMEYICEPEK